MTTLTGPERPADTGPADSIVVFLHGYGADGNDLIGLAEPLAPYLPRHRFVAPNAPDRCPGNPTGFQWFPVPGSTARPRRWPERRRRILRPPRRLARRLGRAGHRRGADHPRRLQPGDDDGAACWPAPAAGLRRYRRLLRAPDRARAAGGGDRRAPSRPADPWRPGSGGSLREPRGGGRCPGRSRRRDLHPCLAGARPRDRSGRPRPRSGLHPRPSGN